MLAILYGCEKFDQFVFGQLFIVETDHKPLKSIFKKPLISSSSRLQCMRLRLQKFELTVVYKRGKDLHYADMLSRSYEKSDAEFDSNYKTDIEAQVCLCKNRRIKKKINNSELMCLKIFIENRWRVKYTNISTSIKAYAKYKNNSSNSYFFFKKKYYKKNYYEHMNATAQNFFFFRNQYQICKNVLLNKDTTSTNIIHSCKSIFVRHIIPVILVANDEPQFRST